MIIPFAKSGDLVSFFLEHPRFQPRHVMDTTDRGVRGQVFRGQVDRTWPIVPSAFRTGDPLSRYTPQTPCDGVPKEGDLRQHLGVHIHAEIRAVHMFLEQADKLGIPTPIDYRALQQHQIVLDAAFQRLEYDWNTPFPELTIIPGFALAQHHGVPTRFVDWTESPLVAAYFAAIEASSLSETHRQRTATEIAILVLNTGILYKTDDVTLVSAPRHVNNHLRAQRGMFVYMPKANAFLLRERRWPSLEEGLNTTVKDNGGLDAVTLPAAEADELLRLLWRYDITRHHLMPNLNHAASSFSYARVLFEDLSK